MASSDLNAEDEGTAKRREDESVKLFVGQVPKHLSEEELMTLFSEFAVVDRVNLIKDKVTKASRGCCFVICPSREEADRAVNACHNKKTLSGALSPLQVKYADGELERLEHKLFIGMLPKNVSESEMWDLFGKYGSIRDLQILRGSQQTRKGCAFLKYETREEATEAMEAINGKHMMEGSTMPLVVKWADTEKERQARRAQKAASQSYGHPSLNSYGSMPMGFLSHYNGYGYQVAEPPRTYAQGDGSWLGSYGVVPYRMPPYATYLPPAYQGMQYPNSAGRSMGGQVEGPPGANLFIYHIPQEFGDEDLATAFKPFGNVLSAKVFVDKPTGVTKCFGFVSFDSPASAQDAISRMNGRHLGGKKLKVQLKRDNRHGH